MKTAFSSILLSAVLLLALGPTPARAQGVVAVGQVGVYDSRQVAFARFWRPAQPARLKELMAQARAAQSAGDQAKFRELAAGLQAEQRRLHLEVFSTAPLESEVDQAWLATRLPEVARAAGVTYVVSNWDEKALWGVPSAQRVDVTKLLVADCPLNEAKQKVMAELGRAVPLPLDEAQVQATAGKLWLHPDSAG